MKECLIAAQWKGIFAFHMLTQANVEASFMVSPILLVTQEENVNVSPLLTGKWHL